MQNQRFTWHDHHIKRRIIRTQVHLLLNDMKQVYQSAMQSREQHTPDLYSHIQEIRAYDNEYRHITD